MKTLKYIELTEKEVKLIKSLERVAKKWKTEGKRLWLFSASGTLTVMMGDFEGNPDPRMGENGGINPNNIIATIDIPNDGGDW